MTFASVNNIKFLSSYAAGKILSDAMAVRCGCIPDVINQPSDLNTQWTAFLKFSSLNNNNFSDMSRVPVFASAADELLDKIAPYFVNLNVSSSDLTGYSSWDDVTMWESADAIFNFLGITRIDSRDNRFMFALNAQWLFNFCRVLDELKLAIIPRPDFRPFTPTNRAVENLGKYGATRSTWEETETAYQSFGPYTVSSAWVDEYYYASNNGGTFVKASSFLTLRAQYETPVVTGYSIIPAASGYTTRASMAAIATHPGWTFAGSQSMPAANIITHVKAVDIDAAGGLFPENTVSGYSLFDTDEFLSMPEPGVADTGFICVRDDVKICFDGVTGWPDLT